MDYKKSQFCKKKKKKKKKIENVVPFQNGGENNCFISRHFDLGQNVKNYFPKGIFQWHEYIYITEITFLKNYSVLKWRPKQLFDIAQWC